MARETLPALLREIRACRVCEAHLPLGANPVIRVTSDIRVLLIGQAPGTKVHHSGLPWNDASGDRLRAWLGVDREAFYDAKRIGVMAMGFCYPGVDRQGGDRPPRPECAPLWHDRVWPHLNRVELVLLIGAYAHRRYLGAQRRRTITETVAAWAECGPRFFPLPHPSWRNTGWLKKNSWFEAETLPALRARFAAALGRAAPKGSFPV
jgi:uracil-DNA glycosylase